MSEAPLTVEAAVEEFLALRRGGTRVDAQGFAARHARLGSGLLDALQAAEILERAQAEAVAPAAAEPLRGPGDGAGDVGGFRVLREIGRGGMGVVYEAFEQSLGRRVALKLLPSDQARSGAMRERFRREAELASRLEHSGICTVFAAGVDGDRPWIAMHFVEGETLARHVARAREAGEHGLSLASASGTGRERGRGTAACLARIARALHYAHEQGVLHRDVKPSNVMVTPAGDPVLLDFGLAREEDSSSVSLTRTGHTAGTPAYLAPELIAGDVARHDVRCDVYALGVTAYECLTLRPPFQAPTQAALYRRILAGAPADPRRTNPQVSRDLAVVVATAMERDRGRRYASAADLAADLEAVCAGRPIAARPVSGAGRALRWARREPRQALLLALCALALLALALAGGFLWATRDEVLAAEREALARQIEHLLVEGFAEVDLKRWPEAEACFSRVLALAPDDLEARAGRILVLDRLGRRDEALAQLGQAPSGGVFDSVRAILGVRAAPERSEEWAFEASSLELFFDGLRLAWEADEHPPSQRVALLRRAIERFEEASLRSPGNRPVFHLFRASAAYLARDAAAARSAAATLARLWPESPRALTFAGAALSVHDPAAGRALLERAAELEPEKGGIHETLGLVLCQSGDHAGAERAFRRAIEIDPANDSAWNGLGASLDVLGRDDEARAAYTRAFALAPRIEILWNLGLLELYGERFQAAKGYLERCLEMDAENTELRCDYAAALFGLGELDAAYEQYEQVVEQQPELEPAWIGLAATLLALDWPAEAFEVAGRGLAIHPACVRLAELRSRAAQTSGRDE